MSQPPRIEIRSAGPGEAALLLDIMLRCWTGSVARNSTAYDETPEIIAAQLQHGHGVLAYLDGELVGGGRFARVPGPKEEPDWVELKRIGVLKEKRGLGIAAPMVAALETEAARRGHPGAQLGVRADQPRLIAFWSSLGYALADDVTLSVINPLTPTPTHMRKWFQAAQA